MLYRSGDNRQEIETMPKGKRADKMREMGKSLSILLDGDITC